MTKVPAGKTLTGTWGTSGGPSNDFSMVAISFPFPVSPAPDFVLVIEEGSTGVLIPQEGAPGLISEEEVEELCPGTADAPAAEPGDLCVYEKERFEAVFNLSKFATALPQTYGAVLPYRIFEEEGYAYGSWAVTG